MFRRDFLLLLATAPVSGVLHAHGRIEDYFPDMKPSFLAGTLFEQVGREMEIAPELLYAVALCESAFNPTSTREVGPFPWVLRTPTKPIYAKNRTEAEALLSALLKKTRSVDVGMMQINVRWHGHRVDDPLQLLDPVTNLRVGASILNELFHRYPNDAIRALGKYHSSSEERSRRYGLTVWRVFTTIKNNKEN